MIYFMYALFHSYPYYHYYYNCYCFVYILIFYCNCLPLKGWQDQCPSRAGSAEVQWCFGRHQNLPTGFPKQNAFPRIQAEVFI